jgi:Histidine kinase-, DNA gyrase B-, and HSP90-like ATPase
MVGIEHVPVTVQDDFVARQTRAKPIPALAELIWNSLDADATTVNVEFAHADLAGRMSKIVVYDNGDGFPRAGAKVLFGHLGGSWKRITRHTKRNKRMIHGQEGRGRYKVFALGQAAEWKVCFNDGAENRSFEIKLLKSDLTDVLISADEATPDRDTGVTVEIADLWREFKVFESAEGLQELAEIFALYLSNYHDVTIAIAGKKLDPETAIASQSPLPLPPIRSSEGVEYPAELHIIQWRADTKRTLYLCPENGFPLDQVETRFHVPGFSFSAYLKSSYIEILHNEERLSLAEMDAALSASVEAARGAIKDYFHERATEQARSVVDEWKKADVYLLLHNEEIRDVIDTIGKKGLLLLGRFSDGRIEILERLRAKLRELGFVPIVFKFDKPKTRDFTETIQLLAGLSRFVIDITNPRSTPLELQATVPN